MRLELTGYTSYVAIFLCLIGAVVVACLMTKAIILLVGIAYDEIAWYLRDRKRKRRIEL